MSAAYKLRAAVLSIALALIIVLGGCARLPGADERLITVTFAAEGNVIAVLHAEYNGELDPKAVPEVPLKEGYTGSWNVNSFYDLTEDITVTAMYSPVAVTVSLDLGAVKNDPRVYPSVIGDIRGFYGETVTLIRPTCGQNYDFLYWKDEKGNIFRNNITLSADIKLTACWVFCSDFI